MCLLLIGAFGLLAHSVEGGQALQQLDNRIGRDLAAHRDDVPWIHHTMIVFTEIGSPEAMVIWTVLVALALMMRRRRLRMLIWLFAMSATGLLNVGLKHAFHRPRPEWRDSFIDEATTSFPSGHSMGAIIAFGLLAYFILLALHDRRERIAVVVVATLVALCIGFSRIYLGAHYFSDVVGGFAVGGAWLSVCISGAEVVWRRAHHRQHKVVAAPPG